MREKAIVTKRWKSWIGTIHDNEFIWQAEWLDELPDNYISLHEFLQLTNPKQTKKQSEKTRREIGYTKVFIYVEDNDEYWAYINHKCRTCKRKCKQSSKVEVVSCPQYEDIDA